MFETGCITPTSPQKHHAPALATVPSLPNVQAMNKLQQDSQCTWKLILRRVRVTTVTLENQ